ncbi:nuclear transport factor 2 family protein [Nocardia sp. XZ_19_369]|uniref:nuclear transport factor 2 family protein n=1 Tax=Nocardia sp. XZ_19_369 TaxID=2769487 RepID=UPI00188F27E7|nr:nuclear transport factor 2 family protein [Nocardia sp. XZ_19_369]
MTTTSMVSAELHTEVTLFYARHMRAMDEGRVLDWTADFTDDGVFETNVRPDPQIGRAAIANGAGGAAQKLLDDKVLRRHCLTTLDIRHGLDDVIHASSYAIIVRTPPGGPTAVEFLCTCDDELIRANEQLLIRRRSVKRDDLVFAPTLGA